MFVLRASFLRAEEMSLLDGSTFEFESVFSMNEDGITFETKNGLAFYGWKMFSETEAQRLSGGKYHEYRELQAKKKEKQEQNKIQKVSPAIKIVEPISQVEHEERKPDFYSGKNSDPARNANPAVFNESELAVPDLYRLIDFSDSIWTWSMSRFIDHQKGMAYLIRDQLNEGVEMTRSYSPKLIFLGMKVWESMAVFRNGRLQELNFLLFNRGDDENISRKEFAHLLEKIERKMTQWIKKEPVSLQDADRNRNLKEENKVWTRGSCQFQLRWSATQSKVNVFSPEYIRLKITPFDSINAGNNKLFTQESPLHNELTFYDLGRRVRKAVNGDICIEGVPMVDQGKKGYCAVASAERVLLYYGLEIDQHQLAELAKTSAMQGTYIEEMLSTLYKIGRSENIKVDVHYDMSPENFEKMLLRYNKRAYKTKSAGTFNNTIRTVEELFQRLDDDLIREIRLKDRGNYKKFKETLIRQASMGIPLLWRVITGIIPENPITPGAGSHMRLIIGFNLSTSEILYTDSWGKGHELKRMSFENAWTMTTGLFTLQPKHWNYSNTGHIDFQLGLNQKSLPGSQKQK